MGFRPEQRPCIWKFGSNQNEKFEYRETPKGVDMSTATYENIPYTHNSNFFQTLIYSMIYNLIIKTNVLKYQKE